MLDRQRLMPHIDRGQLRGLHEAFGTVGKLIESQHA
jgi:hypothetical protein